MALVTSVASSLKKSLNLSMEDTQAIQLRKKKTLDIVDLALDQFQQNLKNGLVQLDSSIDLERLVRCFIALSGESKIQQQTPEDTSTSSVDFSKVAEILNDDDPMVKTLFEKLYNGYNNLNDTDD